MKKFVFIILLLGGYSLGLHAQRANVFAASQLIENGKFEDAKKAIDEAVADDKTKKWSRTWYARGLLCQKAYEKGIKDKNKKLYELYPDQLYVAFDSYEEALTLNASERIQDQLEALYVGLANILLKVGEQHYEAKRYKEALKAFEYGLEINQSEILSVKLDTNLIYNTALAAYKDKQLEKSIGYLNRLNEMNYSTNVPHLLFTIHIEEGDTASAKELLSDGIDRYEENEELVLLLVDVLYHSGDIDQAVKTLNDATLSSPSNYIFPYTKGLLFQKTEQYSKAIEAYQKAISLDSVQLGTCTNIGTCYFNIGVEIEKNAITIGNNSVFLAEKAKSTEARKLAVTWLEKAHENNPEDQVTRELLLQLYQVLQQSDKLKTLD